MKLATTQQRVVMLITLCLGMPIGAWSASAQVTTDPLGCTRSDITGLSVLDITNDVAAGNALLVVLANRDGTGDYEVAIPDAGFQSIPKQYTLTGSNQAHWVHADFDSDALPSGTSIFIEAAQASAASDTAICALEVGGLASASVIDVTSGDVNPDGLDNPFGENMASGPVSTTYDEELLLGVYSWRTNLQQATPGNGFTTVVQNDLETQPNDGDVEGSLMVAVREVSTTGTYEATGALQSASPWSASVFGLRIQQNTAPALATNEPFPLLQGDTAPITQEQLDATDPEQGGVSPCLHHQ